MKYLVYLIFTTLLIGCNSMPNEVLPDQVTCNPDDILLYEGKPYTGKVKGEANGYFVVNKGIITNMILCHSNGEVAIDFDLSKQIMLLKDEFGNQIYKEDFLRKYPHFRNMSDAWDEVYQIN